MAYKPCPFANEGCKYWDRKTPGPLRGEQKHGCYSDLDHIVPQRLGTTALNQAYIQLSVNKQQLCRRLHDEKTAAGDEPLPPIEDMIDAVNAAADAGEVHPNAQLRRIMKRLGQGAVEASEIVASDDPLRPAIGDDSAGHHLEA